MKKSNKRLRLEAPLRGSERGERGWITTMSSSPATTSSSVWRSRKRTPKPSSSQNVPSMASRNPSALTTPTLKQPGNSPPSSNPAFRPLGLPYRAEFRQLFLAIGLRRPDDLLGSRDLNIQFHPPWRFILKYKLSGSIKYCTIFG